MFFRCLIFIASLIAFKAQAHTMKCPHSHKSDGSIVWEAPEICGNGRVTEPTKSADQMTSPYKMQHGFILSQDDAFASHLVANGHHSFQVSVSGTLIIENANERHEYLERKKVNDSRQTHFFLLQAQNLVLSQVTEGTLLEGHIIQSRVGFYEPNNRIVLNAKFLVHKVHLNLANPFFGN